MQLPAFTFGPSKENSPGLERICQIMGYTRSQAVNHCVCAAIEMMEAETPIVPEIIETWRIVNKLRVERDPNPAPAITPSIRASTRRGPQLKGTVRPVSQRILLEAAAPILRGMAPIRNGG